MKVFLTVGTHEQQFDRMVAAADRLAENGQEAFIQFGYSRPPELAQGSAFLSWQEMNERMAWADVVISHGGPGTIWQAFAHEKVPIVFPRDPSFGEHVDDHQVTFAHHLAKNERALMALDEVAAIDLVRTFENAKPTLLKPAATAAGNREKFKQLMDEWLG